MPLRALTHWVAVGLLVAGCAAPSVPTAWGQAQEPASEQITRKLKNKVSPVYPELARRMNIVGVVKVQITVERNGTIKTPNWSVDTRFWRAPPWTQ